MSDRIELPETEWKRVSQKYIVVDVIGSIIGAVVMVGGAAIASYFIGAQWAWAATISLAIIFILTIAFTPRRVRSIGYALRQDDLLFRRGLLFQRFVAIPYGRMQFVDVQAGPLERAFDVAQVQLHTASAGSDARIPGLNAVEAARLRDRLASRGQAKLAGL